MSSLSRLLACSCRSCDCSHMDLVIDKSCRCQWKCCQLDGSRKTSRVSHVVSFTDILTCTFAKSIYKIASCIVSVKTEIVSKVNDAARRLDLVCVHKLAGNAMSQTEENHIRVIQFKTETQVCLTDQIPVYRVNSCAFRRCCGGSYNLNIRVVK